MLLPPSRHSLHLVRLLSCPAQDTRLERPSLAARFRRWADSLILSEAEYSRALAQAKEELPRVGASMPIVFAFSTRF